MMRDTGFQTEGRAYGLAHYLAGQCKLNEIIYTTNPYGVSLIPSGTTVADPINLLDTDNDITEWVFRNDAKLRTYIFFKTQGQSTREFMEGQNF